MVTIENIIINGRPLIKTSSDTFLIRKVGTTEVYTEAIDVAETAYEETEELLPVDNREPTYEELTEAINIIGL